jgi:hypothetical protein
MNAEGHSTNSVAEWANNNFNHVTAVYKRVEIYGKIVIDALKVFCYFRSLNEPNGYGRRNT